MRLEELKLRRKDAEKMAVDSSGPVDPYLLLIDSL